MFLEETSFLNFRNLKNQTIKFRPTINVFYGNNAQGKTNVLEGLYLLSSAKSFRTRSDHELITWGEEASKVAGKTSSLEVEITIKPNKKTLLINKQTKSLMELIGELIAIVFTPADIEIIGGSPLERRRFLDHFGSNLDKKYLYQLLLLNKIIKNRNQTLFQKKIGRSVDLEIWNEQLAKTASFIWQSREELIVKLETELKQLGEKVTQNDLLLEYNPEFKGEKRKVVEERYLALLKKLEAEEIKRTVTLVGPHRDNFKVISETIQQEKVVRKDLAIYGSRGEQRAAALALKLAELSVIEKEKNTTPILLLDEVLSELDQEHRSLLLKQVRKFQTFITTTSLENLEGLEIEKVGRFKVEEGLVSLT